MDGRWSRQERDRPDDVDGLPLAGVDVFIVEPRTNHGVDGL